VNAKQKQRLNHNYAFLGKDLSFYIGAKTQKEGSSKYFWWNDAKSTKFDTTRKEFDNNPSDGSCVRVTLNLKEKEPKLTYFYTPCYNPQYYISQRFSEGSSSLI